MVNESIHPQDINGEGLQSGRGINVTSHNLREFHESHDIVAANLVDLNACHRYFCASCKFEHLVKLLAEVYMLQYLLGLN